MVQVLDAKTAFPAYYYSQEDILQTMMGLWAGRPSVLGRLENFHRHMQVEGRHLALPLETYMGLDGLGERNEHWTRITLELGERLVCDLLETAGIEPGRVNLFAFTTVTGLAVPSIEGRLMNRIPFSLNLKRMPLFGLGCLGGAAGMARLADYLVGHPEEIAILLSVELCSLALQHQDISAANLVSSGLFADGAGAVLLAGERFTPSHAAGPRILDNRSVFFPKTEYIMGYEIVDKGFKNLLSSNVAEVVESGLRPGMEKFLADHGLSIGDIGLWLVHPGGPKVIEAIETGLDLPTGALDLSRESLAKVGNISSASVIAILEMALKRRRPPPGTYSLLMAMGPGFSAELILLQW